MAVEYLSAASITVGGVDLSDHVTRVQLMREWDDLDTTAFGSSNRTRIAGLGSWSVAIDWQQDFAASEVYATLQPLGGTTTTVALKKDSGSTAATNPQFSGTVVVTGLDHINAGVGQLHTFSTTWPGTGDLTIATS